MFHVLDEIVYNRSKVSPAKQGDAFIRPKSELQWKKTTYVWEICCQGKDIEFSWWYLTDIKGFQPLKVEEYSVSNEVTE